ncbi:ABC transporter permease [Roseobacter sp. HKCCA0434]|uniref:ABC transporter permease n=1 Tax=Roseobacter sp. HKCCA0434 TaxID=3079297 RepID=UPI002905B985|nr:ABC transporter permease [Roseobacter sp. HKCCA0434]
MSQTDIRPMGERRFGRWNSLGTRTLAMREIRRFTNVWTQTLAAPMATALLFMLIFVLALGDRRGDVMGMPFAQFLAPGIVMMTVIQNAFANTSSSIVISKVQGNIVDTLMPPLSPMEIMAGYVAGGVARGALVAVFVALVVFPFAGVGVAQPVWALVFVLLGATLMSLVGILAGVYAEKFDQMAAITNFIVTPLSFLSGTFYSIETLPPAMSVISHANPVFYVIDGFRYGILGQSDSSPWLGAAIILIVIAALWYVCWRFFVTGYRLKS